MAEFDALDELLSGSLKRAAQPGDSAGVADAIRARVAAGDVGTPAPSSGPAPGFGSSGPLAWMPWLGLVVVLGLLGGVLGLTGVVGHPVQKVTSAVDSILMPPTVQAESCPGGPVVASVERGARVVALARTADGSEVQIRNPRDVGQLLWVPTSQVDADTGQAAVSTLPLGAACPTVSVAQAPVVVPVTPAKDTTKPKVGKPTATPGNCHTTISVNASDNVGVTSVSISWSGTNTGSGSMNRVGGHWEYVTNGFHDNSTTFVVIAHDAAGNSSSANSVTTNLQCLI